MTGVSEAATDASSSADAAQPMQVPPERQVPSSRRMIRRAPFSWIAGVAALITLALTAALSVITYTINQHNEHRLLDLQVKQTATVLQALLPGIETPLSSAAEIAAAGAGSPVSFRSYMSSYVGATPRPFLAASLWRVGGGRPREISSIGRPLVLPQSQAEHVLGSATRKGSVMLVGPFGLDQPRPRLGYTYAAKGYVVYAESELPAHRHATIQAGSPFSDLRFALYLGRSPTSSALLESSVDSLPLGGDTATASVPFGSSALTLVARSSKPLGGGLLAALWWVVIIVGVVLATLVAVTAEWLVRRRREAEGVVADTQVELAEQRGLAHMLQTALLPSKLPTLPGVLADARYVTGVAGVDIGGDWYDLMPLDDARLFFVVGDVSGRGVPAGTTMAALRFAIRGYVHERHPPATVLDRLAGIIDIGRDGQFATVLCGVLDIERHEVTLASAGHLPPLVAGVESTSYVDVPVGPPIGVPRDRPYDSVVVPVPRNAWLIAFTDGLIERPGQTLDESLHALRSTLDSTASLGEVFDRLRPALSGDTRDDIAILGVQWQT